MKTKIALCVLITCLIGCFVTLLIYRENKFKEALKAATAPPKDPGTNYMTLTNRTFYVDKGVALVPMTTNEFNEISKRFPTNLITDTLKFFAPR